MLALRFALLALGCSAMRFEHIETLDGGGHASKVREGDDGRSSEFASTFRSTKISLDAGRVILSDPAATPLAMPEGEWWLRGLEVEVVNASGHGVPLTEVYLHHIAVYYEGSTGADVCGGANLDSRDSLWDVGAESRGTRTFFPDGFGYRITANQTWSANIHLIRTDGVSNVKRCIECSVPEGGGSEDHCGDGVICPGGSVDLNVSAADYFVQYTVYYDGVGTDNQAVSYHTLDAAACQLEFNVPALCPWSFAHAGTTVGSTQLVGRGLTGSGRLFPFDFLLDPVGDLPPHCIATRKWNMTWSWEDARLVFGKGHLHIGALDMSLYRIRGGTLKTRLCRVVPQYGTQNTWPSPPKPGHEAGYVVGISNCDQAFRYQPSLLTGDVLLVEARYRAQPWYDGVMALFDIAVAPASTARRSSDHAPISLS